MKVLIIEDDNVWQWKLQIIAEKAGLDVMPLTRDIQHAEKLLKTEKPDLILADIHLENGNVFNLFKCEDYRKIPAIFTTSSQSKEDFKMASKVEKFTFLVKPFHQYTLISAINVLTKPQSIEFVAETETSDLKITSTEIKRFYRLLGDDAVLGIFGLTNTEKHILKQRWYEQRTFEDIGKDIKLTGQRIQRLYPKIINKVKSRIVNNIVMYQDYLNFTKAKKNKIALLKSTIEVQEATTVKFDFKTSINSIEELNTKWKNVLWEKEIKTIENLLQYSKKELSMFKKLGPFAVLAIEKVLAKYGFELKE